MKRRMRFTLSGTNRSKWPAPLRLLMRNEGSELLEFALVAIVFLLLVFGAMDFSRALYCYHYVSNTAREATRFAMVRGGTNCGLLDNCPATFPGIQNYFKNGAPAGLDPAAVSVTTTWENPFHKPGTFVRVQVGYRYRVMFPFAFPFLPNGTISMSSSSQMIISQ